MAVEWRGVLHINWLFAILNPSPKQQFYDIGNDRNTLHAEVVCMGP